MVAESIAEAHPPAAAIVLYTVYIPAALLDKVIAPVVGFNVNPAGVELNTPALAPGSKVNTGFVAFWQDCATL